MLRHRTVITAALTGHRLRMSQRIDKSWAVLDSIEPYEVDAVPISSVFRGVPAMRDARRGGFGL